MSEPAQPDNLPHAEMLDLLHGTFDTLHQAKMLLLGRRTRAKADEVSRSLAGVIARLETIRLALKGSRG